MFMKKNTTTDVLSFPAMQPPKNLSDRKCFQNQFLGDILISLDQAQKQAKLQGVNLKQELLFLIIHSILHLIGYDHITTKQIKDMQNLESQLWKKIQ